MDNAAITATNTIWVSDECDTWDLEIPADTDMEEAVRESVSTYDYGDQDPRESHHICITYGTYDEDGDRQPEGALTVTTHPKEWADGEGWEQVRVYGNGGGVKITYRKGELEAVLDTWYQYPHNGQVCQNDHIVLREAN